MKQATGLRQRPCCVSKVLILTRPQTALCSITPKTHREAVSVFEWALVESFLSHRQHYTYVTAHEVHRPGGQADSEQQVRPARVRHCDRRHTACWRLLRRKQPHARRRRGCGERLAGATGRACCRVSCRGRGQDGGGIPEP